MSGFSYDEVLHHLPLEGERLHLKMGYNIEFGKHAVWRLKSPVNNRSILPVWALFIDLGMLNVQRSTRRNN